MLKNKLPSQTMLNPESATNKPYVPHDERYHAEIQCEGEIAMRYVCCIGNTLEELAADITNELRKARHRLPHIVHVEDLETGELITKDFIQDYNKGVYNG
jgi:aspartate oxidase